MGTGASAGEVFVMVKINNLLTTGDPAIDRRSDVLGSDANFKQLQQTVGFGWNDGKLGGKTGLTNSANPVPDALSLKVMIITLLIGMMI